MTYVMEYSASRIFFGWFSAEQNLAIGGGGFGLESRRSITVAGLDLLGTAHSAQFAALYRAYRGLTVAATAMKTWKTNGVGHTFKKLTQNGGDTPRNVFSRAWQEVTKKYKN